MILGLNTTQHTDVQFVLWNKEGWVLTSATETFEPRRTDETLERLVLFLLKAGCGLPAIHGILVLKGPGAFTALRVGVTIANTLAYALRIPVHGVESLETIDSQAIQKLLASPPGQPIEPNYGRPPHIT